MENKHEEISNQLLLELYWLSVSLDMQTDFIDMLKTELIRRDIHIISDRSGQI